MRVIFVRVPETVTEFVVRLGQDSGLFKVIFRHISLDVEECFVCYLCYHDSLDSILFLLLIRNMLNKV